MPYVDVDNLNHDEEEARQGDVGVYDHIMRHDVYHQLGRPIDGDQDAQTTDGDSHNGVALNNGDIQNVQATHDQVPNVAAESNGHSQTVPATDEHASNGATEKDNFDDTVHPNYDDDHTGSSQLNEATTEIDSFINRELDDQDTLDAVYNAGNSILDEFEDPAEFPSDID